MFIFIKPSAIKITWNRDKIKHYINYSKGLKIGIKNVVKSF